MEQLPATINDLIDLPSLNEAAISPDGKWVAFVVAKPDWEQDEFISQIHLVATDGDAAPRQLTFTKSGSSAPRWSPDSEHLIFLSKRSEDKGTQIYRLSIGGGEAERLTELETTISDLAYAPDGNCIAFCAVPPESPQQKKRKETYGDYIEDNVDYQYSHMWSLDVATKTVTQLTSGEDFHTTNFVWHPDSQYIALQTMPTPDMDQRLDMSIYLIDVETYDCQPLTTKLTSNPCWSPDGHALVYARSVHDTQEGGFYKNNTLEIMTLEDRSTQPLAIDFDENSYPLKWADDGIYFFAFQRTTSHLMHTTIKSPDVRSVIPDTIDDMVSMGYTLSDDGTQCAMIFNTPVQYDEIGVMEIATGDITTLTSYNDLTTDWELPQHELYQWQSTDGTPIEGILTKPLDFDPDKKYPLLVVTHGGPAGISFRSRIGGRERRLYPIYQWVHQGAIVLQPNYRGSAGYGEAFRSLNVRNLGLGDFDDVISGVDALIEEGYIDDTKIGKMGWSQGGYITAFSTTYSDRFAAASVGAGISNWMTYYVNTDIHPFTLSYLQATPWDDPDIYAQTSPMTYIQQASTPTLIQHGEKDRRVPIPNAYELHQGLLDQGVESKLVVYPGMPHGPRKPKQVRHIMTDNFNWFNRHIFDSDVTDSTPLVYIALASEKEQATVLSDSYHLAQRDDALYYVVAADGTLSEDADAATTAIALDDISTIVTTFLEKLEPIQPEQVIFCSEKIDDNRSALAVLGCLQIVASQIENLTVKHHIIKGDA